MASAPVAILVPLIVVGLAALVAAVVAIVVAVSLRQAATATDALASALGPGCLFQKTQPWCLWPADDGSPVCRTLTGTPLTAPAPQPPQQGQLDRPLATYLCQLLARFGASLGHNDPSFITDGTGVQFVATVGSAPSPSRPYAAVFDDPDHDACYVAVRGTHSAKDWEADVTYQLTEWTHAPAGKPRPFVHRGAFDIYNRLRSRLAAVLTGLNRKSLFITGHSLGGAIASYLAFDAASTGIGGALKTVSDVRLVTFGSMRPGTPEFAQAVQGAVQSVTTIVNLADIVPSLPPTWLPNIASQQCQLYQYGIINDIWAFNSPQGDLVSNHMLPVHFRALVTDKLSLVPHF